MFNRVLINYLWLVCILKCSEAARILCYQPVPFNSHQAVLHILTEALALDDHHLVALSAQPRKQPMANITEILFHDTSTGWDQFYDEITKHRSTFAFPDHLEFVKLLINGTLDEMSQFAHPQVKKLIEDKNQKFDLILLNANVVVPGITFRARFVAPILVASVMTVTDDTFRLIGADTNAYFYPNYAVPLEQNPSFRQKLSFYYNLARITLSDWTVEPSRNVFIKKYMGQRAPTFTELRKHVGMLFLNVFRFWDRNRPVPIGSVLYMGGFHVKAPNTLPEDLKTFADYSKRGVVIMNMGSKLKSSRLPARTLRVIVDVFSQLPYDFIWKWDADELPNKPNNVRIEKDLPQNDLLHHPNVKAFVTHGAMLSTHEAIAAGVPLVGLPVMPDQWQNARQYEELGMGIRLDIDFLDEEDFKNAIVAVVEDKRYRENMVRWSRIAADERERSLSTAARWARRLAERGARLLRCPLADTTFADFYMLDIVFLTTIFVFVVGAAIVSAVKRLCSALRKRMLQPIKPFKLKK